MTRQAVYDPSFLAWVPATRICSVTKPVNALKGKSSSKAPCRRLRVQVKLTGLCRSVDGGRTLRAFTFRPHHCCFVVWWLTEHKGHRCRRLGCPSQQVCMHPGREVQVTLCR